MTNYEVGDLFHSLRKAGNLAVHENQGTQREALHQLRIAWRLGVWFQRGFKHRAFKSSPFVPPPDPARAEQALKDELSQLRQTRADFEAELAQLKATTAEQAQLQVLAQAESETAYEELATALELAGETEARAAEMQEEV